MAKKAPAVKDIDFEAAGAGSTLREVLGQIVNNQEQLSSKELVKLVERAMGATWKVKPRIYQGKQVDNVTYHFLNHRKQKYTQWKTITDMNQMVSDLIRNAGRDIYLRMLADKVPTIVFYDGKRFVSIDLEQNKILTIFSFSRPKKFEKQLRNNNSKFIKQKKGRTIKKWWVSMEKVSEKDSFEVAWQAWINHHQDLLLPNDYDMLDWKANLVLSRSEIEDYLETHPDALSEKEKEALVASDQWLLDHADEPVIQKFLRNFTDEPSMKYWWEDIETLIKEKENRESGGLRQRRKKN